MNGWTDERVDELKRRRSDNETFTEIAIALGVSRNAVIGKARRLSLPVAVSATLRKPRRPGRRYPRYNIREAGAIIQKPANLFTEAPVFLNAKRLLELTDRDCRWPGAGRGPDLQYCGAPAIDGKPYCLGHCRLAYIAPGRTPRP